MVIDAVIKCRQRVMLYTAKFGASLYESKDCWKKSKGHVRTRGHQA